MRQVLSFLLLLLGAGCGLAEDTFFIGHGSNSHGWIEAKWGAGRNYQEWGSLQLPWAAYDNLSGECRLATGNIDGHGSSQLVVGMASYPAAGGYVAILNDGAHGYQVLRWVRVPWSWYDSHNGETFPACGDLYGSGYDDLVLGMGAGGYGATCILRHDGTVQWLLLPAGNIGNGATHPACGDISGDGKAKVLVGTGQGGGGRVAVYDNGANGCRFLRWLPTPQDAYATSVGEAWPACGDIDGNGDAEVFVGRGSYPAAGGYIEKFASLRDGAGATGMIRVPWANYCNYDGATRPTLGDIDGDRGDDLLVGLGPWGHGYCAWLKPDGTALRWEAPGASSALYTPDGQTWPAIARGRATAMFAAFFLDYNLSSGPPLPNSTLDSIIAKCSEERIRKLIVGTWSTKGMRRGVMWAQREAGKPDLTNGDGTSAFLAGGRGFSLQHLIDAGRAAHPPVEVFTSIVDFGENTGVSPYQDAHSSFLRNNVIRYITSNYPGLAGVYLDYIRYAGKVDTFESGTLTYFPWQTSGGAPWHATQSSAGSGTWSAQSGAIGDSQSSDLQMTVNVPQSGSLTFMRRVSSEAGGDFLRFYIDGVEQAHWSGEVAWGTVTYPVAAGTHTFRWSYVKDGGTASGSDCAWIDQVTLPAVDPTKVTNLVAGIHDDLAAQGMCLGTFLITWAGASGWRDYLPYFGQDWESFADHVDYLSPMAYAGYSSYYTTLASIHDSVLARTRFAVQAAAARNSHARVQTIIATWADSTLTATPLTIWSSLEAENQAGGDEFSMFRWGCMDSGARTGEWAAYESYMNNGPAPSQ